MNFLNKLPLFISQKLTEIYFKTRKYSSTLSTESSMQKMLVKILPALEDNYMYLLICTETNKAIVVDPVEPEKVLESVKEANVDLVSILTTHHHWDHAGGNEKLLSLVKKPLEVYGGDDRIGGLSNMVKHNDTFKVGNLNIRCLYTPCHTKGHICYFVEGNGEQLVFTGDTLFQGGCGRFFEGTAEEMFNALIKTLSALPNETKVFCGHEYTLQNLKFAKHVEAENVNISNRIEWAKQQRAQHLPTVPSTIGEEKSWNPFMRVLSKSVQSHVGETDPIKTMEKLRKEKDNFK